LIIEEVGMGIIFAGHGGLDVEAARTTVEICAIPQGTTLQFYTDSGQKLRVDHDNFATLWSQVTAPWPALDSTGVTYNLTLQRHDKWVELCEGGTIDPANFHGHQLVVPGFNAVDEVQLCTGTAYDLSPDGEVISGTCPTDPRQIEAGWTHTCDGLLKEYAGQELFWLACTSVLFAEENTAEEEALESAVGERNAIIDLGSDPDQEKLTGTVSNVLENGNKIIGEIVDGYGNTYVFELPADSGVEMFDNVRFDGAPGGSGAFNVVKI
jgi:hypothetical protein